MESPPPASRRHLIRQFVVGAAGWWAAGSWSVHDVLGAVLPLESTGTLILPLSAFPVLANHGGSVRLAVGLDQSLIVSRSGNTFFALGSRCTHNGCTVDPFVLARGTMRCACHGSEYFIDGTVKQGPAPDPLDRFATTFNGSSEVRVTLPRLTFAARLIQVGSPAGNSRRIKLSFHATPFQTYRVEYRTSPAGTGTLIPFSLNPTGSATQSSYRSTLILPTDPTPLVDVYVDVTETPGFFAIVLVPSPE